MPRYTVVHTETHGNSEPEQASDLLVLFGLITNIIEASSAYCELYVERYKEPISGRHST